LLGDDWFDTAERLCMAEAGVAVAFGVAGLVQISASL
jgi:hypothetical protein